MKLYRLTPIDPESAPWKPWYDRCFGVVVRAKSEGAARTLAADNAGDEGRLAWLAAALSRCDVLKPSGPAGVIIEDVRQA